MQGGVDLTGKRVLITQAEEFMEPALCRVLALLVPGRLASVTR